MRRGNLGTCLKGRKKQIILSVGMAQVNKAIFLTRSRYTHHQTNPANPRICAFRASGGFRYPPALKLAAESGSIDLSKARREPFEEDRR